MDENQPGIERNEQDPNYIRIKKIPLEDMLNILENLYEAGTNFIDLEFYIDPHEIQSVITITTRPEYMASNEELEEEKKFMDEYEDDEDEDDDEDDDPILSKIKKESETPDPEPLSDDELNELM